MNPPSQVTRMPFHGRVRRIGAARPRFKPALMALALAGAFGGTAGQAQTNPSGGVAIHGQASFSSPAPNQLSVTTRNGAGTNHSAINWQSFSIPAGSSTNFQQPNAASTVINRVVTNTPSAIFGSLSSNGKVVLVNQSGIAIGAGAVVDTAGFTASALRMTDADALAGRLRFGDGLGSASDIAVDGRITARNGDVVLVAPNLDVGSSALIQAANGSTVLAAGQQVEITGRGLEGITMLVQAPHDTVRNLGTLQGDAVGIFAATLRHSGAIQATAASAEGGKVVLKASDLLEVEGTVRASGLNGQGGVVHATADKVWLKNGALVDVSGASGGGEALIGGGWHGDDARISNAQRTLVSAGAQIKADALDSGNGGTVVVWSDAATGFYGSLSARGGTHGGDGGHAEVSGKHYLDFRGGADLTAGLGHAGSLLLDPANIFIINGTPNLDGSPPTGDDLGGQTILSTDFGSVTSIITAAAVATQLTTGNVLLQATTDIDVSAAINYSGGAAHTLTLDAGGDIRVTQSIVSLAGPLGITMTAGGGITSTAPIDTRGGAVTLTANGAAGIAVADITTKGVDSAGAVGGTDGGNVTLTTANGAISVLSVDTRGGSGASPSSVGAGLAGGNGGDVSIVRNSGNLLLSGLSIDTRGGIGGNGNAVGGAGGAGGSAGSITLRADVGTLTLGPGASQLDTRGANGGNAFQDATPPTAAGGSPGSPGTITIGSNSGSNGLVFAGDLNVNSFPGFSGINSLGQSGSSASFNALLLRAGSGGMTQTAGAVTGGQNVDFASAGAVLMANLSNAFAFASGGTSVGSFTLAGASATGGTLTAPGNISLSSSGGISVQGTVNSTGGSVSVDAIGGTISGFGALITAAGPITLNSGAALALNNVVSTTSTVTINSGGAITQTGGSITAGGLTTIHAGANSVSLNQNNDFSTITSTSGALTLVDANSLVVDALGINSSGGDVNLSATGIGRVTLNGLVNAGAGNVTLSARGITEAGLGAVTATTFTANGSLGGLGLNGPNNVAAARLSAGGGTASVFNNNGNYLLSGSGGSLSVTGTGHVTVDQTLNFAGALDISSNNGIKLQANTTSGANFSLTSSTGRIEQTAAGNITATGGTATIDSGSSDIDLTLATNNFNVISLAGGNIGVIAAGGLIVNGLASGTDKNVFLQAGAGGLTLAGTAVNITAGLGQISLISGSTITNLGDLIGSDILLQVPNGLVTNNINASGTLLLSAVSGGVTQAAGTAIVASGLTTATAGSGPVSLSNPANNFNSIAATGGAITLVDVNALSLAGVSGSSVAITAGGAITQASGSVSATGNLSLTGASMGVDGSGNYLQLSPAGSVSLTAQSGGIYVQQATGNLNLGQYAISSVGVGQDIKLVGGNAASSNVLVNSFSGFQLNTNDDNIGFFTTASFGNLLVFGGVAKTAQSFTLGAEGNLASVIFGSGAGIFLTATNGVHAYSYSGNVGVGDGVTPGDGVLANNSSSATGGIDIRAGGNVLGVANLQTQGGGISVTAEQSGGSFVPLVGGIISLQGAITTRGADGTASTNPVTATGKNGGAVVLQTMTGGISVGAVDTRGGAGATFTSAGAGMPGGSGGDVSIQSQAPNFTLTGLSINASGGNGGNSTSAGPSGGAGGNAGEVAVEALSGSLNIAASVSARGGTGGNAASGATPAAGGGAGLAGAIDLIAHNGNLVFTGVTTLDNAPGSAGLNNAGAGGVSAPLVLMDLYSPNGSISQDPGAVVNANGLIAFLNAANNVTLNEAGNSFGELSGTVGGNAAITGLTGIGDAGLSAGGALSLAATGSTALTIQGPLLAAGNISLSGNTVAIISDPVASTGGNVTITGSGGISLRAGTIVSGNNINLNGNTTLDNAILVPGSVGVIGSVNVTGNLTMTGSSTLLLDLASATSYDTVNVTGNFSALDASEVFALNDLSAGTLTGTVQVLNAASVSGTPVYSGPSVYGLKVGATAVDIGFLPPPPAPEPPPVVSETKEVPADPKSFVEEFLSRFKDAVDAQQKEKDEKKKGQEGVVVEGEVCK